MLRPRWTPSGALGPAYDGPHWSQDGTWKKEDFSQQTNPAELYSTAKKKDPDMERNPNNNQPRDKQVPLSATEVPRSRSTTVTTNGKSRTTSIGGDQTSIDAALRNEVVGLAKQLSAAIEKGTVPPEKISQMQAMLDRSQAVMDKQRERATLAEIEAKKDTQP